MRKAGKKIDVLHITHGAHDYKVELRLDKETGKFHAELGGETFVETDLAVLKKKLHAQAETTANYEFRRYIDIKLGFRAHTWGSSDFEDMTPENIAHLEFDFSVYERSQSIESDERDYKGRPIQYRLERELKEVNGKLAPERPTHVGATVRAGLGQNEYNRKHIVEGRDDNTIDYTEERYAKLKAIRAGLYELARRLNEVVGDGKKAAAALDGAPLQQLLPPDGGAR